VRDNVRHDCRGDVRHDGRGDDLRRCWSQSSALTAVALLPTGGRGRDDPALAARRDGLSSTDSLRRHDDGGGGAATAWCGGGGQRATAGSAPR